MTFLNALAWLVFVTGIFMVVIRFWAFVNMDYLDQQIYGRAQVISTLRYGFVSIVALLWIIFG